MALKSSTLRDAITVALVMGTAVGGVAHAQNTTTTTSSDSPTNLDRIQVTGSRIRQVDIETAQPVTFVTREDIQRQGFQSVADILQTISSVGTPPITRASPLSSGENVGGQYISLRNLGSTRTLILLNGRRLGISTSGLQDMAAIPASAIERLEVLKDGASSIYGSDAIAGVINIITRTGFEGAEANVYYGQFSQGDGAITNGSFTMGFTGDRGSLTVTADTRKENGVNGSDRWFSAFTRTDRHPTDQWTAVGEFGGFTLSGAQAAGRGFTNATFAANPNTQVRLVPIDPNGDLSDPANYRNQNTNVGSCPPGPTVSACIPGSTQDKTNTNEQMDVLTPLETKSLFVDGTYDLTDSIRFRTNLAYFRRSSERMIAGYPMQAGQFSRFGVNMSPDSYFNPTDLSIGSWWRRTWEVPRISEGELNNFRFTGAFEGFFEVGDRIFDWDVSYLHSQHETTQKSYGNLNLAAVQRAVGPSFLNGDGVVQCGTATSPIPLADCRPFNPFVPFGTVAQGGLTDNQALQDYLFQTEHSTGKTETQVFAASIAGSVVTLPAGDLGFAAGVESRKETGEFVPDALAVTGGSTNLAATPTRGGYRVDEVYLEVEAPLLADMPFARELTVTAATRYSDFDTFGDTTNDKFGLRWRPVDSLLLRATVADGFRAPTISDLFGGGSQTFAAFTDPCDTSFGSSATNATTRANCRADLGALADTYRQLAQGGSNATAPGTQTPVAFTSGSNPNLTPEVSKSQTIGFVWSPEFVDGLNVAVDWWKIRIDNTIVADAPTTMLNDCYVQGIQSRCVAPVDGAPGFTRDPVTGTPTVVFAGRNAGFRKAEGYDIDLSYRWDAGDWGRFNVTSNTTYTVADYLVSTNDPRRALSGVGIAGNPTSFRVRSNLGLSWDYGDFGMSWTARYSSSMKEGCTYFTNSRVVGGVSIDPPIMEPHLECNEITYAPTGVILADGSDQSQLTRRKRTGSVTFNDVQFRWQAPWDATIAIGANNVFERYGPAMYSQPASNFAYYGGFDIGRFVYMKYQQRF